MLLLPVIEGLWLELLFWAIAWLAAPVLLVWFGKYRIALAVVVWWAIMYGLMAFLAFDYSAKPYHPDRDAALGSSFAFAMAVISCLASLSTAVLILVLRRGLVRTLHSLETSQGPTE